MREDYQWPSESIALAREIVGRVFGAREAQELPIRDLFELAAEISREEE